MSLSGCFDHNNTANFPKSKIFIHKIELKRPEYMRVVNRPLKVHTFSMEISETNHSCGECSIFSTSEMSSYLCRS